VTARDTLFVLRPGFLDDGQRWFCPFAAQVEGMLSFYPELRGTLEIVEIDFAKPRQAVVELLGEHHQATPVLVLHADSPGDVGVKISEANGHRFVEKTLDILKYLAVTRGVPEPHPPK
jgi:hypothetical protein